jgi:hypothetical protein
MENNCNVRPLTVGAQVEGADNTMSLKGHDLCCVRRDLIPELGGGETSSGSSSGKAANRCS